MTIKKLSKDVCSSYIDALTKYGEDGLYKKTVGAGFLMLLKVANPDVEIMDYSDAFFALYRRTGDESFFQIGRVLRRASHTIYRELMRQNKEKKPNFDRFLNGI